MFSFMPQRRLPGGGSIPFLLMSVLLAQACLLSNDKVKAPAGSTNGKWREMGDQPAIAMGQHVKPYILWNDPSVLREGRQFRMWLSGGDARNLKRIVVEVYQAFSSDGEKWDIDPNPVVRPSASGWDSLRIETPSVIKVGNTYHMYYTGFSEDTAKTGISQIGHATSPDGVKWIKDPLNPVLKGQSEDKLKWAYGGVGEPGIMYLPKEKRFYLYYTGMKYSNDGKNHGLMGILLATSEDGSHFSPYMDGADRKLIFFRNVPNATKKAWFGYSTPSAVATSDGTIHLFATFVVAPKGPTSTRHVVLAHGVSTDGVDFQVKEENMFEAGRGDWKDFQVRSPTVVEFDHRLHMWFAGERQRPFGAAIGYAVEKK